MSQINDPMCSKLKMHKWQSPLASMAGPQQSSRLLSEEEVVIRGQGKGGGIAKGVFMKERAGFSNIFLVLSNLSCFFLSVEQSVIGLSVQ